MSTRDIKAVLVALYGVPVIHDLTAQVTDAILEKVRTWRERPLGAICPVIWLDELMLKVRLGMQVANRCVHVVLVMRCWVCGCPGVKGRSSG